MSNVSFDDQHLDKRPDEIKPPSALEKFLYRFGITTSKRETNRLLIIIAIIVFIIALIIIFIVFRKSNTRVVPYNELPQSTKNQFPPSVRKMLEEQSAQSSPSSQNP